MNRRLFVSQLGSLSAFVSMSGLLGLTGCSKDSRPSGGPTAIPEALQGEIAHLADMHFEDFAKREDENALYQNLLEKGILTDTGEYSEEAVAAIASIDATLEYRGFYYTQTEMELYSLAFLLTEPAGKI